MNKVRHWVAVVFKALRQLSGDDSYERYVAHHHACHAGESLLDRRAFYLRETQRKWSGVKRCC